MAHLYSASVPHRAAPRRSASRRSPGSRGSRGSRAWLWLVLLLVIGGGVVAARTLGRGSAAQPLNEPTPVRQPLTTPAPVIQPVNGSTPVRTSQPSNTSTPVRNAAAPAATPRPVAPPKPDTPPKPSTPPTPVAPGAGTARPAAQSQPVIATSVVRNLQPLNTPTPVRTATTGGVLGSVALTFDAGADRGYAEDILDVLAEQRVVAGFGITGVWARANPDLVRRMAADGHLVFNHTLDHRSFTGVSDTLGGLSAAARRAELDDADAIIAPLIGHSTRPFYRLPYGDDDAHVATDVGAAGYTQKIGWTVDSLGWRGLQSADIEARCLKLAASGAVYVLHVGRASQDAIALPNIIRALRERGFGFRRLG